MNTYTRREPVEVRLPTAIQGEFTFVCTKSRSIANIRICNLAGSPEEQHKQSDLIGAMEEIIRSLEFLRCHGAVEIRMDQIECAVLVELNVLEQPLKERADDELDKLRTKAWILRRDWPDVEFKLRVEMGPEFIIKSAPAPAEEHVSGRLLAA